MKEWHLPHGLSIRYYSLYRLWGCTVEDPAAEHWYRVWGMVEDTTTSVLVSCQYHDWVFTNGYGKGMLALNRVVGCVGGVRIAKYLHQSWSQTSVLSLSSSLFTQYQISTERPSQYKVSRGGVMMI